MRSVLAGVLLNGIQASEYELIKAIVRQMGQ